MRQNAFWVSVLVVLFSSIPLLPGQKRAKEGKGVGQGKTIKVVVKEPGYEGMYYWLFTPKGTKKGRSYPLILALHGNGEKSHNRIKNISRVSTAEVPAFVVSPQYQKGNKFNNPRYADCSKIFRKIVEDLCKSLPVDRGRIILQGYSMGSNYGGKLIWDWYSKDKETFPFCTFWMSSTVDPGWLRDPQAPDIPYLLFVGDKEVSVMGVVNVIKQAREGYRYFFKKKMDATYLQIPKMGHSVNRVCLSLMREHLASLPSYCNLVTKDPKLPDGSGPAVDLCLAGSFGSGLKVLSEMTGTTSKLSMAEKSKVRKFAKSVESYLKKVATKGGKLPKRGSPIAHFREMERMAGELKGHKTLAKPFGLTMQKLGKHKKLKKELQAYRLFLEAREKGGKEAEEVLKGLATGKLADTEYGIRAKAHMRAMSDDYGN